MCQRSLFPSWLWQKTTPNQFAASAKKIALCSAVEKNSPLRSRSTGLMTILTTSGAAMFQPRVVWREPTAHSIPSKLQMKGLPWYWVTNHLAQREPNSILSSPCASEIPTLWASATIPYSRHSLKRDSKPWGSLSPRSLMTLPLIGHISSLVINRRSQRMNLHTLGI